MTEYEIRAIRLEEIPIVVEMVRSSFDNRLSTYMIYGQPGISTFLSVPFRYPKWMHDRELLVAVSDNDVLGFAEFRLIDSNTAFLSYICVAPQAQGRGIASHLISKFLAMKTGLSELNLDVFRGNIRARDLYEKLGFRRGVTSAWVTRSLPPPQGSVGILSLPAATAAFDLYGFCEVDVVVDQDVTRVGLIGACTVRCSSTKSFEDDVLLTGLREVFTHLSSAFAIIPEAKLPSLQTAHEVLTLSDRMTLAI